MMKVTRREFLCGAGGFTGAVLLAESVFGSSRKRRSRPGRATRRRADSGPLSGARLYEDVISYYNLGDHRTASQVDLRTSQWLVDQLRSAGLKATFQSFPLRQFSVRQTRLLIGEQPIRAFPLWYPRSTGEKPIIGVLKPFELNSESRSLKNNIALVSFPASAGAAMQEGSVHSRLILSAATAGATAVVAVTESATREIIALNSPAGAEPWPIPVILVGQRDEPALIAAAKSATRTSLLLDGQDDSGASAKNVIARVNQGKDLIVVSTPQSGWFRCAGERGPGIAMFLGLARWASKRPTGASFLFVSTSGHELGGLGMQVFLKDLAPSPERVLCWLHLGAGIATYLWEETAAGLKRLREPDSKRLLMSRPDLVPLLTSTFAGIPGLTPTIDRAVGEYEFMLKAGYRVFGIAAGHRFHHTPADSPETTGPEILEPVAHSIVKTLEAVEAGEGLKR
ncbi:MAG TPA: hypothetical protein VFF31_33780 [Blastocatellia bacterium]|nr:hypothetical protein [Blastocatellia bacterium]